MNLEEELSGPLLKWERKTDGVYLTYTPQNELVVSKQSLLEILQSKDIMNFDWPRICQVIDQARGKSDFVGPNFVVYDRQKDPYITVNCCPEEACLRIDAELEQRGFEFSMKEIEYKLLEYKVVSGINWAAISDILRKKMWNQDHIVATATLPQNGIDAQIKEKVPIDPDAKPIKLLDGRVDFKNIQSIQQISQGDLIAVKIPLQPGKSGQDIFGHPLPPAPGVDRDLPAGLNTNVDLEGRQLFAAKSGYLYRHEGTICVGELFCIAGDVNFKTGNIKYSGDVIINGSVLSGFSLDVMGSIHIAGSVEASTINSRTGSICIEKGVFGKDVALLSAHGPISLSRIQDTKVESENEISISHSMRNCSVRGMLVKLQKNCEVIGSQLSAYQSMTIECPINKINECTFVLLDKLEEDQNQQLREFEKLLSRIIESTGPVEKRLKGMQKMLHNPEVEATEKIRAEVKQTVFQFHELQKKARYVTGKIAELKIEISKPKNRPGYIRFSQGCPPKTKLVFYDKTLTTQQGYSHVEFYYTPDGIQTRPIQHT